MAAVGSLSACTSAAGAGAANQQSSTLQDITRRGTLNVASCLTFPPFGSMDKHNKPQGFDVDVAGAMAKALGVKVNVVDTTSANRIPNLQTKKVDAVVCNFTATAERAKQVAFTDPYIVAGEVMLVKKSSGINGLKDVSGKTVAVTKGSTNGDAIKAGNPKAKVQEYDTSAAAVLAVKQGQADAMVEDSNFLNFQAKSDPSLKVTKDSVVPLEYNSIGVPAGDPAWLQWVNTWLREFNTSGQAEAVYKKWFGVHRVYPLNPSY
ncbi:transporter substrate-binding domain-containing protein [Streptomyces antnestii]|uniref:Transporter substrate-binding domain-containing protein n=1 Tax=Streptomyces antnestii TaxID=2494256 RepID=A0A3S2YZ20_9ACTN|nr:transporter substrate-binding domain-containing protein [Streptomyces sp. San01]RVU22876.1 transporter substrate-binding domain-containing protein [Streptomyces sp. San01]